MPKLPVRGSLVWRANHGCLGCQLLLSPLFFFFLSSLEFSQFKLEWNKSNQQKYLSLEVISILSYDADEKVKRHNRFKAA
jgi:hypothetical protein